MSALLAPLACFILNIGCQVLLRRAGVRLLATVFAGFLAGLLGMLSVLAWRLAIEPGMEALGTSLTDLIIFGCLGYCYFHFINLSETARRIRILREIYAAGGLTGQELLARYNSQEIIEKRLTRLLDNRQVVLVDGKYFMRPSLMLAICKLFILARRVILGKSASLP